MQANRDSIMKPAAAARRYRRLADAPRPKPVSAKLHVTGSATAGARFMFRS
jgi:hypothetical protein